MDLATIKSVLGDFSTFWKNFTDLFTNLSKVFRAFGGWDQDRQVKKEIVNETKTAFQINK